MGATSALAKTVPVVSSKPGTTPNPVQLNGTYNPATGKAELTITKSDAPNFAQYDYRYCAGTKYTEDTAAKLATIANISTLTLATNTGLNAPGSSIAIKCYVVTDTGNAKASNTLIITRP